MHPKTSLKVWKIDMLKLGERIDDLQINGEKIIQGKKSFCYGVDAVLLSNFVKVKPKDKSLIDLGTGTGIIPIIVAAKSDIPSIVGVEIQEDICDMAVRSVKLNKLENRIEIYHMDIKNVSETFPKDSYDIVTSNPPYMNVGKLQTTNEYKAIARQEIYIDVEGIFNAVNYLLKPSGKFYMVHRPSRLSDIFFMGRKYNIEPKVMRFVHPKVDRPPNIVLIQFTKNAKSEIKIEKPLYVHREDGKYTQEIVDIYSSKKLGTV